MFSEYTETKEQQENKWSDDIPEEITVKTNFSSLLDTGYTPSSKKYIVEGRDVFILESFLSKDESERIIAATESYGYGKTDFVKSYRGNQRLRCEDSALAETLFERLKPLIAMEVAENHGEDLIFEAIGLNTLFRFSKYFPGDRFQAHIDAAYKKDMEEDNHIVKSMYTLNLYLNDDFEGGLTRFYVSRVDKTVQGSVRPKSGDCLVFRQPPHAHYLHDGEEVGGRISPGERGHKYLLRTDVVYRSKTPSTIFTSQVAPPAAYSFFDSVVQAFRRIANFFFPTAFMFPRQTNAS
jgi:prolyl 4-hydroxylase